MVAPSGYPERHGSRTASRPVAVVVLGVQSCPLAFRFSYLDRLPEPPSAPASKGTLVHRALEHLMLRGPEARTIAPRSPISRGAGPSSPRTPSSPSSSSPTTSGTRSTPTPRCSSAGTSSSKTPRTDRPDRPRAAAGRDHRHACSCAASSTGSSSTPTASSSITDYKTGSVPGERYETEEARRRAHVRADVRAHARQAAGAGAAALPLEARGDHHHRRPSSRSPASRARPRRCGTRSAGVRTRRLPPEPGPLCDCCSFQAYCPAFGGDPLAGRRAARPRPRDRAAASRWPPPPRSAPRPMHRRRIRPRFAAVGVRPASIDVEPIRSPVARPRSMYPLSSAADHSLLWFGIGAGLSVTARRPRFAARFAVDDGRRVGAHERGDQVAVPPRCGPSRSIAEGPLPYGMRRPITSSFPSGHATAAFTARRRCSPTGPAPGPGTRSPPSSPRAGSTSGCTTRPTSSPAPRLGLALGHALRHWVRRPGTMTRRSGNADRSPDRLTSAVSPQPRSAR